MARYKLDTGNSGNDEILFGDSVAEVTQDVLNRYEVDQLPEGWTIEEIAEPINEPVDYTAVATEVFEFRFATDSEQGSIMARDFTEAKAMLAAMIEDSDGGSGWVEDKDGYRFECE